ncbi:hypothetical protein GCM10009836_22490 [Pseudonocardia ailaonensis]|uniref:Aldehyde-activating protein n=1 Tax=Pseudonocardia ailaonensis TaxID=367279 RepID=A0ABN2MYV0_9PSEU
MADTVPLSTHHTSEGWVRYRRCGCGSVSVELVTLEPRDAAVAQGLHRLDLHSLDLHTSRA